MFGAKAADDRGAECEQRPCLGRQAQPAGGVAVLFRVYAKFVDNSDDAANAKIAARLQQRGTPPA